MPSTSLSTRPTCRVRDGSQALQTEELAIEISGASMPMAHSKGPQVTNVASPIGIGSWFAPISCAWTANVTPVLTTMLCMASQLT